MYSVDVWRWPLDVPEDVLPGLRTLLADDELKRAVRFVRPTHRDRYVAARARLRQVLGALTGCAPRDIVFRYGANGKPFLDDGPAFNLSHSGPLAALAVGRDGAVGLDIERIRPIEDAVARRHFSRAECAALDGLPVDERRAGFYRCWTRKEAVIKACGLGLSMPLDSFDVTLAPGKPARLLRIDGDAHLAWRLVHFEPGPGYVGAVAARTGGREIVLRWRETPC